MRQTIGILFFLLTSVLVTSTEAQVECVVLGPENWNEFAPAGKEVDAIYGDLVLRNSKITAVIARPTAQRAANMTVRSVGGCVIDLTSRTQPNDQLSCFYPGADRILYWDDQAIEIATGQGSEFQKSETPCQSDQGIRISIAGKLAQKAFPAKLVYYLGADAPYLEVQSQVENSSDVSYSFSLPDMIRADNTFSNRVSDSGRLIHFYDSWFHQSYGIMAAEPFQNINFDAPKNNRKQIWTYRQTATEGPGDAQKIEPGQSLTWQRYLFPCRDWLEADLIAAQIEADEIQSDDQLTSEQKQQELNRQVIPVAFSIRDASGPVTDAKLAIAQDGKQVGYARTDRSGTIRAGLQPGTYNATVTGDGRPTLKQSFSVVRESGSSNPGANEVNLTVEELGTVQATITDESGQPLPCKVSFHGLEGTNDPDWGPDSRAIAIKNVRYSENGVFSQAIGPGNYRAIISHGPEYNASVIPIEIKRGEVTRLTTSLKRSVDTTGWISAEYHSHSSPSGDNTGDQLGRVMNLLAEHIEFAPCTEHQRIDTYLPHLERLNATHLMATCPGMELTGKPLPTNHQNAFPLIMRPRTQDGGGPSTAANPIVQIQRLKYWDDKSEKLVQINHPNLNSILGDQDGNGEADEGFGQMFNYVDVIEVHPPASILQDVDSLPEPGSRGNAIFIWMQMLNLGYRIPGVVNTDAHYNFHGSGWLRNYVRSSTDDPAEIDTMEMVRNSAAGRIVMSTGPFMTVSLKANNLKTGDPVSAQIGDQITVNKDSVHLQIKVQCPDWLDINRVQVLVNGRKIEKLNFTRRTTENMFQNGTVQFDQSIAVPLTEDAHLIVVAAGEGLQLGQVMGPRFGEEMPIAVSNPIYVDIDGNGFQANGDRLGAPILMPVK